MQRFIAARDFLLEHRTDQARACRDFRWPQLDRFNWALDYFDSLAQGDTATRTALWLVDADGSEQRRTFGELSARSNQVANHLRSLGVRRGERVLLMLGNVVPLWEATLAVMKLGAVVVPTTMLAHGNDLADRMQRGQVSHAIVDANQTGAFDDIDRSFTRIAVGDAVAGWHDFNESANAPDSFSPDAPTHADDPMLLYFTSGTTSKPKLVMHSHQSYPVGHLSTMYWVGIQPGDIHLNVSSPGWAKHAWSCLFAPWNAAATVFIYNSPRFDAAGLLDTMVDHEVTTMCAPPTVWRMLIQQDLAARKVKLRELASAGEPLNSEVISQVEKAWGLSIRDGYGQTETTAIACNGPGQKLVPGSMGRPAPGYRIELLDIDGNRADEGEISLAPDPRPLGLMLGYADDPEHTRHIGSDGYYRTGDVGSRDADGYITYVGRADDVFKSSDYRISPFELESALIEHPAVAEAAVIPSPDPVRMSVPKAFVTLVVGREASTELAGEILMFIRERLAPYKRIRRLEFHDLPKTMSGKIRRVELRRAEMQRTPDERLDGEYFDTDFR
ncbi:MAG TPA: AMP-binding protein [Oleiagrimonas sp.]|nr:AMP-binding protein [Oleiagrimonas sp.]